MNELIELHEAWGKPQQAEQWRAKLPSKKDTEDNTKGAINDKL
ncbi:MAG: hypothetical protein ACYS9C_11460 [Planctomycetota bacterium]|jgi:hypothetical protein